MLLGRPSWVIHWIKHISTLQGSLLIFVLSTRNQVLACSLDTESILPKFVLVIRGHFSLVWWAILLFKPHGLCMRSIWTHTTQENVWAHLDLFGRVTFQCEATMLTIIDYIDFLRNFLQRICHHWRSSKHLIGCITAQILHCHCFIWFQFLPKNEVLFRFWWNRTMQRLNHFRWCFRVARQDTFAFRWRNIYVLFHRCENSNFVAIDHGLLVLFWCFDLAARYFTNVSIIDRELLY